MDVEVRHAEAGDSEELLELWHGFTSHLAEFDERYQHRESANERWLEYFENRLVDSKYGTVLVADTGDRLVGALEARVMGGHPIFRIPDHGYINGHFVREDARGQGVGRALLEAAIEWFDSRPREIDVCRVDVMEGDEAAARSYERLGFAPVEHVYERSLE